MLAARIIRETEKINEYEKRWKIQTNINKFQLLSISAIKTENVIIDNNVIEYKNTLNTLGLTLTRTGVTKHIKNRLEKAKIQSSKLLRFRGLSTNINIHLYKTTVKPILEYPIIPLCISSRSNLDKLQARQNICLRRASKDIPPYNRTVKDLHELYNINPLNIVYRSRAQTIWDKITEIDNYINNESNIITNNHSDHFLWRRTHRYLQTPFPDPIYGSNYE